MSTGNFENFTGIIADIGPMYPFVGTEKALFLFAVVSWVVWHIVQLYLEKREYAEEVEKCSEILDKRLS